MFEAANYLRTENAANTCKFLTEVWAIRECVKSFKYNTWNAFVWNEALARAARHVINEEGACGTVGDANSLFVSDVLGRYYAMEYEGLKV